MFATTTDRIHTAAAEDIEILNALATQQGVRPLDGRILIGERYGLLAAAISLGDGRVIADDAVATDHLIANLRMCAISIWAQERTPSLPDRIHAGLPARYGAVAIPTSGEPSRAPMSAPEFAGRERDLAGARG